MVCGGSTTHLLTKSSLFWVVFRAHRHSRLNSCLNFFDLLLCTSLPLVPTAEFETRSPAQHPCAISSEVRMVHSAVAPAKSHF